MSLFNNILYKKIIKHVNRIRFKWRYQYFLRKKSLSKSQDLLIKKADSELDIITIAFNNAKMIEYQILLIKKYLKDSHTHIIADNSNNLNFRQEIRDICLKHNILYVSIPLIKLKPSWSHAAALHWVFNNIVLKRNSPYFGFIDHDIFPTEDTCIITRLWNGVYGRVLPPYGTVEISQKQPFWSLWGGFFFFDINLFKGINPFSFNFFPKVIKANLIMDTVGGLWDPIFSQLPRPDYGSLLVYKEIKINNEYQNIQSDAYEKLDEWIHMVNLSEWYTNKRMENKKIFIQELLDQHL